MVARTGSTILLIGLYQATVLPTSHTFNGRCALGAYGLYGYTDQPYKTLAAHDTVTNKRNARQREPALALALDLDLPASNQF